MIRKTILAIAAVASLSAVALAPTTASAWKGGGWHKHHHHVHFGHRFHGPRFVFAPRAYYGGCYLVKRWVDTPWGPRLRRVQVCA